MIDFGSVSVPLAIIFICGLVAGAVACVVQAKHRKPRRAALIGGFAIAVCSWVIGTLTEFTQDRLKEASIPPSTIRPGIVKFELGFRKIELNDYTGILSADEEELLRQKYTPPGSIFLSKQFVSDFNTDGRPSGLLKPGVSRRYSGKEFYTLLASGLENYGELAVWKEVVNDWINQLDKMDKNDTMQFKEFVANKMGGFLRTTGFVSHTTQAIELGEINIEKTEVFDCERPKAKIVVRVSRDDVRNKEGEKLILTRILFRRWGLRILSRPDGKEIVDNLIEILDKACIANVNAFLKAGRERIDEERGFIERAIKRVNTYYDSAIPRKLTVTSVVSNPGRFGVAVLANGTLAFDQKTLKALPIAMAISSKGQHTFNVPSREVREVLFSAELPDETAATYRDAFRSRTSKAHLKLRGVGGHGGREFLSKEETFGE